MNFNSTGRRTKSNQPRILVVAELLLESALNEDEQLQMIFGTAVTRTRTEN
jgi:hypothetical protein